MRRQQGVEFGAVGEEGVVAVIAFEFEIARVEALCCGANLLRAEEPIG